jgi:hypothetical protein
MRDFAVPQIAHKAAVENTRYARYAGNSGLEGTTSYVVVSGVPGRPNTRGPNTIEIAIAPIENNAPAYQKARFIKSDERGHYSVALPPGTYWVGPKAKALDPTHYHPTSTIFSEQQVVVKEGTFTHLDLVEVGYAP